MLWILLPAVASCLLMEPWSRLVHRIAWHGPLWGMHSSHHTDDGPGWETNDWFVVLHMLAVAPLFVLHGVYAPAPWARVVLGLAIGISTFGTSYFIVHDGLVHGRLPVGFLNKIPALRRIAGAHRAHHKTGKAPYGLFLGPQELRQAAKRGEARR